jgi:putrescine---pyruvate transaminase
VTSLPRDQDLLKKPLAPERWCIREKSGAVRISLLSSTHHSEDGGKMPTRELADSDRQFQIHSLHHPSDSKELLIFTSGNGIYIRDADGRQYIDGLSGLWNVNVGHGRAELADAAAEQMKTLAYFSGYAGSSTVPSIHLAERLIELAPGMAAVFFTSGGAEANESAFKTARYYWKVLGKSGKSKVISRIHGYHGVTLQAMSATGMAGYWKMFEPRVPGFLHVQTCYPYRCTGAKPGETPGETAARDLEEAILHEGPETVAAFIGEPIHGAGGVIYPTDDYWPRVREICNRYEILLIADEIITGFGRTGRWFGLEHWNVQADIVSIAKGVSSGYLPLGGIMVTRLIKDALDSAEVANRWMHGFTNSGHPACCAVAIRNLEIIEREGLLENSSKMGNVLVEELRKTFGDHPNVGDIRGGRGLLAAVEFVEDRSDRRNFTPSRDFGNRLRSEMRKRGVITRTRPVVGEHPAPGDQVLFAPPLVINEDEVRHMVAVARESVDTLLS